MLLRCAYCAGGGRAAGTKVASTNQTSDRGKNNGSAYAQTASIFKYIRLPKFLVAFGLLAFPLANAAWKPGWDADDDFEFQPGNGMTKTEDDME
eukprot:SAG31_NODE_879_length_11292_cov_49.116680_6_plen_94_part_00